MKKDPQDSFHKLQKELGNISYASLEIILNREVTVDGELSQENTGKYKGVLYRAKWVDGDVDYQWFYRTAKEFNTPAAARNAVVELMVAAREYVQRPGIKETFPPLTRFLMRLQSWPMEELKKIIEETPDTFALMNSHVI